MNSQTYPTSTPHQQSLDSSKRLLSLASVFGSSALMLVGHGTQQQDFSSNEKRSEEARRNHPQGGNPPNGKRPKKKVG